MRYFSYVVARDYGFAPNPFFSVCTLATCKARIRAAAKVGDWVVGTGSARYKLKGRLAFLMQVSEKLTLDQYWNDPRFQCKKPVMNGSLKMLNGDNIYRATQDGWEQADSHHSYAGGETNWYNYDRDTKADAVLIAETYYYFGEAAVLIPPELCVNIEQLGVGYRCPDREHGDALVEFITSSYESGYQGEPASFRSFKRYNGR